MRFEGSLPYSQEPAAGHCLKEFHNLPPYFFKIHFNIIQSTPRCFKRSHPFRLPGQTFEKQSLIFPMCATSPIYVIPLDLMILIVFVKRTNCGTHYAVLSNLPLTFPVRSKYVHSPEHRSQTISLCWICDSLSGVYE
jgi:hypothetical protein